MYKSEVNLLQTVLAKDIYCLTTYLHMSIVCMLSKLYLTTTHRQCLKSIGQSNMTQLTKRSNRSGQTDGCTDLIIEKHFKNLTKPLK